MTQCMVSENAVPIPSFAQDKPMLAKGPECDHGTYESKYNSQDVIDYDDPANNPFVIVPPAPRKSARAKVMSGAGAASAAFTQDTYHFTANVLQSITSSTPGPEPVPSVYGDALKLLEVSAVKTFNVHVSEAKSNPFADLFDPRTMSMHVERSQKPQGSACTPNERSFRIPCCSGERESCLGSQRSFYCC